MRDAQVDEASQAQASTFKAQDLQENSSEQQPAAPFIVKSCGTPLSWTYATPIHRIRPTMKLS